jgi:hypothetical protein
MEEKYSIFHIEGGLGKHIVATAICKTIKNNYPDRKLIVVCSYSEVFINLDFVYRVYKHESTPYFYSDFIDGKDFIIFKHEPYFTTEHIKGETNLIENWSNLYKLDYSGESPEIRFNVRQRQFNLNKWNREKPIFLIQTNGGPLNGQPYPYSWTRDMPNNLIYPAIEKFKQTHHIIQICRDKSQSISGIESIYTPLTNMELFGLIGISDRRFLIDSSLQHASKALNKVSTVIWIGTNPKIFGYDTNINISAKLKDKIKLPNSYLFNYSFTGLIDECPIFNTDDLFDVNEVIELI